MLKVLLMSCALLFLISCSTSHQNQASTPEMNQTSTKPQKCPRRSRTPLKSENVEDIKLDDTTLTKSGKIASGEMIGYQFHAERGQKLNYNADQEVCIWIYSPEQTLIEEAKLPYSGDYIIQISTINSSTNFEIDMTLSPIPPPSYSLDNFPKSSCGDILIETATSYPVHSYPTDIAYSTSNLQKVREMYCEDAFIKLVEGNRVIQVASFEREVNAQAFSEFISQTFQSAQVGKERIITQEMINNAQ